LIFQTLDSKSECTGIYVDGQITTGDFNNLNLTATWSPGLHFTDQVFDCAIIRALGSSLDDACPDEMKETWRTINKKAVAFMNSFKNSQVNLDEVCFYDLLPNKFLLEFYGLKNDITKHIIETCEKPKNYDFMYELLIFLKKIENQNLNLNFKNLNMTDPKVRRSLSKLKDSSHRISYNPWGTVTGRLATNKNSFPILTLNKELRSVIEPTNNCLLELDFNAAEIRVLFSLLGQNQPDEDIHSWISKNIFNDKYDREQSKKKVFAWLYNPRAKNKKLNSYLKRDALYDKYYKNGHVETPFGRKIKVTKDKAVNYLVQSTTSDLFLTSAIKIDKMLEDKKSNVCFCIHDSLVLDYAKEDQKIISEVVQEFSDTKFGFFNTNLSMGKNFGMMRKIE
jgi:hypothetical protein